MKNNIEVRPNGSTIEKKRGNRIEMYYVKAKDGAPSLNGPWDYLANARQDADSL